MLMVLASLGEPPGATGTLRPPTPPDPRVLGESWGGAQCCCWLPERGGPTERRTLISLQSRGLSPTRPCCGSRSCRPCKRKLALCALGAVRGYKLSSRARLPEDDSRCASVAASASVAVVRSSIASTSTTATAMEELTISVGSFTINHEENDDNLTFAVDNRLEAWANRIRALPLQLLDETILRSLLIHISKESPEAHIVRDLARLGKLRSTIHNERGGVDEDGGLVGRRCLLVGCQPNREYDGTFAHILSFDDGFYKVRCSLDGALLGVRPCSLVPERYASDGDSRSKLMKRIMTDGDMQSMKDGILVGEACDPKIAQMFFSVKDEISMPVLLGMLRICQEQLANLTPAQRQAAEIVGWEQNTECQNAGFHCLAGVRGAPAPGKYRSIEKGGISELLWNVALKLRVHARECERAIECGVLSTVLPYLRAGVNPTIVSRTAEIVGADVGLERQTMSKRSTSNPTAFKELCLACVYSPRFHPEATTMSPDDSFDFIIGKGISAVLKDAELALSIVFELCRYPFGCRAVARDGEVFGLVQALCGVERAFPVVMWAQDRGRAEWFARDAPSSNVTMPACVEQAAVDCLGRCLNGLRRPEDAPLALDTANKLLSPPNLAEPTLHEYVGPAPAGEVYLQYLLGARQNATAGLESTLDAIKMDAAVIAPSRYEMLAVAASQLRANVTAIVNGQEVSSLPAWSSTYTMDRLSRALRKDPAGMSDIGYARHVNVGIKSNLLTIASSKKAEPVCAYGQCKARVTAAIKLRVCSRCQQTQYCSKACQQVDWKQHKKVCLPLTKQKMGQKTDISPPTSAP